MAFIFTCGTHTFQHRLEGYENVTGRCANCGNFSATPLSRWEWFTFCFVPIIPFSLKPWHDVGCPICNFHQALEQRPDIQQMGQGGQPIPLNAYGGQPPPPGSQPGYATYQPPANQNRPTYG